MNVVSFYRFVDIAEPKAACAKLRPFCGQRGVLGTVLVAGEGLNGMLAGEAAALRAVLDRLQAWLGLDAPLEARWTAAAVAPFRRLKVRHKSEIVALGRPDIRPQRGTGRHVAPRDWNRLIENPDTLVIDTRNHYETVAGTFPRAVDPGTDSFRQFPDFATQLTADDRRRPVAMFCTGGIRCEKASALLLELGFTDLYQLQGGVLNYLEQMRGDDNRWQGDCFVFDDRVTVDRNLAEGGGGSGTVSPAAGSRRPAQ